MILAAIIICCLGLFVILCKQLEARVDKVVGYQHKTHRHIAETDERISQIETHNYKQDARMDRQQGAIQHLRADVNEMGKDIGWKDDDRKTRVMKQKDPDDAA